MSSISAGTTTTTGYVVTSDTTGALVLKTGASGTTAVTIGSDQSVTFAGSQTFSGGTANGVLYLNGSKVVTSGSALVFDGTNLGIGVSTGTAPLDALSNSSAVGLIVRGRTADSIGTIQFRTTDSASLKAELQARTDELRFLSAGNIPQTFYVNGSEQMRLTSTGLGIGTSSPLAPLDVTFAGTSGTRRLLFNYDDSVITIKGANATPNPETLRLVADNFRFNTGTTGSGTEKMRLDLAGNLGIGTTSPTTKLSITDSTGPIVRLVRTSNRFELSADTDFMSLNARDASTYITFKTADTERARISSSGDFSVGTTLAFSKIAAHGSNTVLDSYGQLSAITSDTFAINKGGQVMMGGKYRNVGGASDYCAFAGIAGRKENATDGGYGGYLQFLVSDPVSGNIERARIDSSGNLLLGATAVTASAKFLIQGSSATYNFIVIKDTATSFPDNYYALFQNDSGANAGKIAHTGSTTVSYVTSSDYRLKENVQPMVGALDKVAQLKPCTYTWKADGTFGQGFIAHELQAIVPEAVVGKKDALNEDGSINAQGIDTSFLVATLTAAIQEQQAIIESLTQRIAALEGR